MEKTRHICHCFCLYETVSAKGAFSCEAWGIAPGFYRFWIAGSILLDIIQRTQKPEQAPLDSGAK